MGPGGHVSSNITGATADGNCCCTSDVGRRYGGSSANEIPNKKLVCEDLQTWLYKNHTAFAMSGQDWIDINEFARNVGWSFLFDVNVLIRNNKNKWSGSNARKLLKFSSRLGYDDITWELGNEPNSLKHQLDFELDGRQLGRDFKRLRKLLDQFLLYKNSSLVGPDVNQLRAQSSKAKVQKALKYLGHVYAGSRQKLTKKSVLDAITWHHYYMNGHTATIQDFLDIERLNYFPKMIQTVGNFMKKRNIQKPLWLGETSSAWGSGAPGLSDRYIATYLWLDKLGQSALHNYQVIIRQTFYHGCYAMVGEDLYPNPDFWISALYKRLVSTKVFQVQPASKMMGKLRIYSHCGIFNQSLVLYGLNVENITKQISFKIQTEEPQTLCTFNFTPVSVNFEGLRNRNIKLNGQILRMNSDDTVPDLLSYSKCSEYKLRQKLEVAPYGLVFWLFKDFTSETALKMCQ